MTRQECFDYIRIHNLKDEANKVFGKNYSNVKTDLLIKYVETAKNADSSSVKSSDYCTLKKKYNNLLDGVISLLLALNDEVGDDVQKALKETLETVKG